MTYKAYRRDKPDGEWHEDPENPFATATDALKRCFESSGHEKFGFGDWVTFNESLRLAEGVGQAQFDLAHANGYDHEYRVEKVEE